MGERITLELDAESIAAARAAGIDLSQLLAEALRRRLPDLGAGDSEEAAKVWYAENKDAVDAYNRLTESCGLFADGVRAF